MTLRPRFLVVGTGWRADLFARVAHLAPEHLELVGVVARTPSGGETYAARWGVPWFGSVAEAVRATDPTFVLSAVPWAANPDVVRACVELGVPVLSETPPAPDLDGLRRLWADVGASGLVQVAEQYPSLPGHRARKQVLDSGRLGVPTSVQISSTHLYHAVALVRSYLGLGLEPARVLSQTFVAPLMDPLGRDGWTGATEPTPATTTLATLDFGGATGLYDFTDNQWHNQLRSRRVVVRGSHGELVDDDVVRWVDPRRIIRSQITRRQRGYDLDLDGYDTEHLVFEGEVVYENPLFGCRMMDEEIALGTMLLGMGAWCQDAGPAPYALDQACHDHALGLAIEESARTGQAVRVERSDWS